MPDDLLGVVLSDLNGTRRAEIGACPGLAAQPDRPARSSAVTPGSKVAPSSLLQTGAWK